MLALPGGRSKIDLGRAERYKSMTMSEWKDELGEFLKKKAAVSNDRERSDVEIFIVNVVQPAFDELKQELEKHGRTASMRISPSSAQIAVQYCGADEFTYRIQGRTFPERIVPYAEIVCKERKGVRLVKNESMIRSGPDYSIQDIGSAEIIRHFLSQYMSRVELAE